MSLLNDFDNQVSKINKYFSLVSDKLDIATPFAGTEAGEANREGARTLLSQIEVDLESLRKYEQKLVKKT